jgi:hypothetical protein
MNCSDRGVRLLTLCGLVGLVGCGGASPNLRRSSEFQRGVALGLFVGDDPTLSRSDAFLEELRDLGATDVSLVVTWVQDDVRATTVRADPAHTASDEALGRIIRRAHALGLRVMLFPILRLIHRTPREWRGLLAPVDEAAWFASYAERVLSLADLAERERVEVLSVGSELVSLESRTDAWRRLASATRAHYHGQILYSANWDRYDRVPFWDAVDLFGVSAYWDVARPGRSPSIAEAVAAWRPIRDQLLSFQRRVGRPLVLTEIGYPSVRGAGAWPWNDFLTGEAGQVDAEVQRRLYEAFTEVWSDVSALKGVYVWLWFDAGGIADRSYTPRGKPAEYVLKGWYRPIEQLPPLR